MANVGAHNGGCWYCGEDTGELLFCSEFDTYLHLECLRKQVNLFDIDDIETRIIAREFANELHPPTLSQRVLDWIKS